MPEYRCCGYPCSELPVLPLASLVLGNDVDV